MKKIYLLTGLFLFLGAAGTRVQAQNEANRQQDSLQQVVNQLTAEVDTYAKQDFYRKVWTDRAKYFNIGYVKQTLTDKTFGGEIKSDFGVSLSNGKTYYLHKKPIAGMMKFGLDWSWMDINYAKSTTQVIDEENGGAVSSEAMHQLEYGMQFGPSFTINPVHHLKVSGYFRVTPSYSMLYMNETLHHHYVTMWNAGFALAWKMISVGAEWRWGSATYKGLSFDESNFDEDSFEETDDPSMDDIMGDLFGQLSVAERKLKTSSLRLYVSFRF